MSRVGVIGAGQLGLMLGQAGSELGIECRFLDPAPSPPAARAGPVIRADYDDTDALRQLAGDCQILTYEFENVPFAALAELAAAVPVHPPPAALRAAQDRLLEKQLFQELDIPLPRFCTVDSTDDLRQAAEQIGLPLVLKTRRFGYDGKGQTMLRCPDDIESALRELPAGPLIAEQWIAFDREVSAIGVRRADGALRCYPLTENVHHDGILHTSRAPAGSPQLTEEANQYVGSLMSHLNYVGVLALELFVTGETLLANEIAPRVHNSGHWTIEGAATSQFGNHLRAIRGLPLGPTAATASCGMINLIGAMPEYTAALQQAGVHLHDYGKTARSRRKLGHITVTAGDAARRDELLAGIAATLAS